MSNPTPDPKSDCNAVLNAFGILGLSPLDLISDYSDTKLPHVTSHIVSSKITKGSRLILLSSAAALSAMLTGGNAFADAFGKVCHEQLWKQAYTKALQAIVATAHVLTKDVDGDYDWSEILREVEKYVLHVSETRQLKKKGDFIILVPSGWSRYEQLQEVLTGSRSLSLLTGSAKIFMTSRFKSTSDVVDKILIFEKAQYQCHVLADGVTIKKDNTLNIEFQFGKVQPQLTTGTA